MKNQLHLNLNVTETLSVDNDDNERDLMKAAAATAVVSKFKRDGVNVETVTTVPQQQQQQQQQQQLLLQPYEHKQQLLAEKEQLRKVYSKAEATRGGEVRTAAGATRVATSLSSSPSLLNSSSTALAKFNRIIDNTMPATNYYQHHLPQEQMSESMKHAPGIGTASPAVLSDALQQRLALVYPDIVSTDSQPKKINFTTATAVAAAAAAAAAGTTSTTTAQAAKPKAKVKGKSAATHDRLRVTRAGMSAEEEAANLKAAAAVTAPSDDDNQMKRNDVHYLLKQLNSFSDIEEIEIVDMEQRQRQLDEQQQLAQQQQQIAQQQQYMGHGVDKSHSPTAQSLVIISPSSLSHKGIRRYASLHQQQCTQYTLDSDEAIDTVEQQQYLLQQFDDYLFQSCHYLETNYFAANYRTAMVESSSHEFRPSTTTTTGTSAASVSSEQSLELHETEPPSVICKAPPPVPASPPTTIAVAATKTTPLTDNGAAASTSVTPKRYGMQARLTSSGVQTELTATSLTEASLAKSTSSSASSEEQRRRAPFFKCCYTPIDRWREKRSAAHTAAAAQKRGSRQLAQTSNVSTALGSGGRGSDTASARASETVVVVQQRARKNGHAV
ncbi:uncharacterized protein LOC110117531 [Ceratitis capitata]|uniref:uncharacterized protein LOC110117531 n=1 Tax=Ceratitis capitata TaxID=7213 RepID=UPI000A0F8D62|nr:uncharacterized protein LOC110117531 [Ceratitis capitata]